MTATRNPHYWRKGYPYLNSITYKPIINAGSRADALQTGQIDIMHSNSPDNLLQFQGNKKYAYYDNSGQIVGQPTVQCIMLNTVQGPVQQQDAAPGHGDVHQPGPVHQGHRQGHRRPDERALPAGERVLHQDRLPEVQPHASRQAGQAGAATDGQASLPSRSIRRATPRRWRPPSSCSRPGRRRA